MMCVLSSHFKGIGFSGDTFQAYSTLQWQTEMTATASNVGFGWWSHDIGGNHNGGGYPGDEYVGAPREPLHGAIVILVLC